MSPFLFSLACASIITFLMILSKAKENLEHKSNHGIKVFVISFLTIFVAFTYFGSEGCHGQEIDVGEPPF